MKAIHLWVVAMLVFGTTSNVLSKTQYMQDALGRNGTVPQTHRYDKPYFESFTMFLGMTVCMIAYAIQKLLGHKEYEQEEMAPLTVNGTQKKPTIPWKVYFVIAVPAIFDLLASTLMGIGLLWVSASVYQMMRGALMVFGAILAIFFLKRRLYGFHWIGVVLCVVALAMVGLANLLDPARQTSSGDQGGAGVIALGMALILLSQLVQASQIVVEDHLMSSISAPAFLIVGMEGIWGTVITGALILPIVQFTPLPDGCVFYAEKSDFACKAAHLYHEDTIDSFDMLGNNPVLLILMLTWMIVIFGYNAAGMKVTQTLKSVVRTILEACRTMGIWIVDLMLFYCIGGDVAKHSSAEDWDDWSWLQLAGFLFLLLLLPPTAARRGGGGGTTTCNLEALGRDSDTQSETDDGRARAPMRKRAQQRARAQQHTQETWCTERQRARGATWCCCAPPLPVHCSRRYKH